MQDAAVLGSLVDELSTYSAADVDGALTCFHERVGAALGAERSMTVFAIRDPRAARSEDALNGWLPAESVLTGRDVAERLAIAHDWHTSCRLPRLEPTLRTVTAAAGSLRAFRRRELGTGRELASAPSTALLEALGLDDRLHGAVPVAPDAEVHVVFDRLRGDGAFGRRDKERLLVLLHALGRVARTAARARGYVDARRPLSPRARSVLRALLTGRSEKEIAADLALTTRSLHQYVVAIYRAFGVRSRAELTARFL